jgi:pyruvate,water dikinase
VSPLFASWFLPRASDILTKRTTEVFGMRPPPPTYALVNGWYFFAPLGAGGVRTLLGGLLRKPRVFLLAKRAADDPVAGIPPLVDPFRRAYEDDLAPRHRALAAEHLGHDPTDLIDYVDRACVLHGDLMFNMTFVGGSAWKIEAALARFFRKHCRGIEGAPHELVAALAPVEPSAAHHACSLDWVHPTAGELGLAGIKTPVRGDAEVRRETLERACVERLPPKRRVGFEKLLELARQYARLREAQAHDLTLAWPNVRTALRRLGEKACASGTIASVDDVFWLRREELDDALAGKARLQRRVAERRATWERQRKLAPPLVLGKMPGFMQSMFDGLARDLRGDDVQCGDSTIVGMPASAGRATGKVRLVRSAEDFHRLSDGEVLVAPTTAPAWTPLFSRAVAVITDGGSIAAHASLVAREYGIPAVVGTVDATLRLHDGQLVTVDGTVGRVDLL